MQMQLLMSSTEAESIEFKIILDLRKLAAYYGCRLEISSDEGFVGKFCVTASDPDRHCQGFGPTVSKAVDVLHGKQLIKGSK